MSYQEIVKIAVNKYDGAQMGCSEEMSSQTQGYPLLFSYVKGRLGNQIPNAYVRRRVIIFLPLKVKKFTFCSKKRNKKI